jgi:hypothetical protein
VRLKTLTLRFAYGVELLQHSSEVIRVRAPGLGAYNLGLFVALIA